jgi:LytS/YehU family sensor histidine kinase
MGLHDPFVGGVETFLQVTGLRIMVEYLYTQQRIQALRNENLSTELAFLKSQINPHFLFNTLNNIAVLSEKYPEKVTPTIIDLSNVLRYQLYESDKETVLLSKEIENLRQNLSLEAMRLNDVDTEIRVEGHINGATVAPLLFLPFLENALKHSADPSGKAFIDIAFKMDVNVLTFTAENSKPALKPKQLSGGIGLKNIQRRLALLYPQKHILTIEDLPAAFKVTLVLML